MEGEKVTAVLPITVDLLGEDLCDVGELGTTAAGKELVRGERTGGCGAGERGMVRWASMPCLTTLDSGAQRHGAAAGRHGRGAEVAAWRQCAMAPQ